MFDIKTINLNSANARKIVDLAIINPTLEVPTEIYELAIDNLYTNSSLTPHEVLSVQSILDHNSSGILVYCNKQEAVNVASTVIYENDFFPVLIITAKENESLWIDKINEITKRENTSFTVKPNQDIEDANIYFVRFNQFQHILEKFYTFTMPKILIVDAPIDLSFQTRNIIERINIEFSHKLFLQRYHDEIKYDDVVSNLKHNKKSFSTILNLMDAIHNHSEITGVLDEQRHQSKKAVERLNELGYKENPEVFLRLFGVYLNLLK